MRKLVAISAAGAAAALCTVAMSPTASQAAVKRHVHRHIHRHVPPPLAAGCYRWGETGYHWYPFCLGPSWLYPHHRVCHHGYCWYR